MLCLFAGIGRRQDPAAQRNIERVPPSSMQDSQVEKAPEICAQTARNDEQSKRPSRSRIGRQEHENGPPGWRGSLPLGAARYFKETASDPCGSEDPQGYLGQ